MAERMKLYPHQVKTISRAFVFRCVSVQIPPCVCVCVYERPVCSHVCLCPRINICTRPCAKDKSLILGGDLCERVGCMFLCFNAEQDSTH